MSVQIRLAETDEDRLAVYRFRYDIYVLEMSRVQAYADHQHRTVVEPLDATGDVWMAEDGNRVVGTVRCNVGVDEHFGYYTDLYRLKEFGPFFPHGISITTKLIVGADYRRTGLPIQLCVDGYSRALERGAVFDVMDCNPPLVKFFSRFGYRQVFPDIHHPEYGHVIPMVLALRDTQHLRTVRSPFLRGAGDTQDDCNSGSFLSVIQASNGLSPKLGIESTAAIAG